MSVLNVVPWQVAPWGLWENYNPFQSCWICCIRQRVTFTPGLSMQGLHSHWVRRASLPLITCRQVATYNNNGSHPINADFINNIMIFTVNCVHFFYTYWYNRHHIGNISNSHPILLQSTLAKRDWTSFFFFDYAVCSILNTETLFLLNQQRRIIYLAHLIKYAQTWLCFLSSDTSISETRCDNLLFKTIIMYLPSCAINEHFTFRHKC